MRPITDLGSREESAPPRQAEANEGGVEVVTGSSSAKTTNKEEQEAYSCFTSREKWGIISLISLASIFS